MRVSTSKYHLIDKLLRRYSFQHLLVWLLLNILASPFLQSLHHASIISSVSISLVLLVAVYAINRQSRLFKYLMVLMVLSLLLFWMGVFNVVALSRMASLLIMALYVFLLVYAFTRYVFSARKVDSHLISAALCLYLLMGTLWGILYNILDLAVPGSFSGALLSSSSQLANSMEPYEYLSFVTLTTLGYGDILPQTPGAAALCQVEAVVGQFYMAVMVARLVGIQVSQEFSRQDKDQEPGSGT